MPDRDIMYSKLVPCWRRPYRLAKGDASAALVASEADKALAATLRRTGGCPGLPALAAVVARAVRRPGDDTWRGEAERVVRSVGGHKHSRLAQEVAEGLIEADVARLTQLTDDAIETEVAKAVLRRLALSYAFGPIQPVLIAERFGSAADAIAFEAECLASMNLEPIAAQLLRSPSGEKLRAPARRAGRKRPLRELVQAWP